MNPDQEHFAASLQQVWLPFNWIKTATSAKSGTPSHTSSHTHAHRLPTHPYVLCSLQPCMSIIHRAWFQITVLPASLPLASRESQTLFYSLACVQSEVQQGVVVLRTYFWPCLPFQTLTRRQCPAGRQLGPPQPALHPSSGYFPQHWPHRRGTGRSPHSGHTENTPLQPKQYFRIFISATNVKTPFRHYSGFGHIAVLRKGKVLGRRGNISSSGNARALGKRACLILMFRGESKA